MSARPSSTPSPAPGAARPGRGRGRAAEALRALVDTRLAGRPAVLLVAAGEAERSGWAAQAALELAAAAGERAVLVDLDPRASPPHRPLEMGMEMETGGATVAALLAGAPLSAAARPAGRAFAFVAAGDAAGAPRGVLEDRRWAQVIAEAASEGRLLLLYLPSDVPGLASLARVVGGAVVFSGADADRAAWGLPPECAILAAMAPRSAPPARPPRPADDAAAPKPSTAAPSVQAGEPASSPSPGAPPSSASSTGVAGGAPSSQTQAGAGAEDRVAAAPSSAAGPSAAPPIGGVDAEAPPASSDIAASPSPEAPSSSASPSATPETAGGAGASPSSEAPLPSAVGSIDPPSSEPPAAAAADAVDGVAAREAPGRPPPVAPSLDDRAPEDAAPARVEGDGAAGAGAPGRYVVPRQAEWKERLIRAQAALTLALWTAYVVWRWGWTLNPDALWFSIPLALAETWGLLSGFLFVHSVWRLRHRTPLPAPPGLTADVFIPCFDEPLEVVRRTAVAAHAIRYPHRTWVLDDGKRDEVEAMAREVGVGYLRREGNEHAKAGNLNHALANTDGEFVLVLDADHAPLPQMLDRLLGFLANDAGLAFVQSPQDFYNTDGFTYQVDEPGRRLWEEQRLFFSVLQPGKDARGAAFFCGSAALLRRSALESVGGFSHHSITEDIETSLRLHASGWRSAFYGESLAYGLAAGSAAAFHTQHLRWGQGAMQVLKRFNPLTLRGLTLSQRLSYFASLTAYFGGVQKLVFLLAPLAFFVTGVLPIRAESGEFLLRFLPVLAMSLLMSGLLSRGIADLWISERFHVARFWTYTRATFSLFRRRPLRFRVTPKGPGQVPFRAYAPQAALMAASAAAVAWAFAALGNGWVRYGGDGSYSPGFLANLVWATVNFVLAASVVQLSLRTRQQRADHRFRDRFPIEVRVRGADGAVHTTAAVTENLNPGGIGLRTAEPLRAGTVVKLRLPLTTGAVRVSARVVHSSPIEGSDPPAYRSGAAFVDIPVRVRDAIELHCTQHAVPQEQARYRASVGFLESAGARVRNHRREPRRGMQLAVQVTLPPGPGGEPVPAPMAFLEDLSESGARLVMDRLVEPGTLIRFRVPGTGAERAGRVVFAQAVETPLGGRYVVGVERTDAPPPRQGYGRRSLRAAARLFSL